MGEEGEDSDGTRSSLRRLAQKKGEAFNKPRAGSGAPGLFRGERKPPLKQNRLEACAERSRKVVRPSSCGFRFGTMQSA